MHTTTSPGHPRPETDAEIDAAVRAFMIELTGTGQPVGAAGAAGAAARCYQHAAETIAEEVTEMLATMTHR